MNIRHIATQISLIPTEQLKYHINGLLYPIRSAMVWESLRRAPDEALIASLTVLEGEVASACPEATKSLESTLEWILTSAVTREAGREAEKPDTAADRLLAAKKRVAERVVAGWVTVSTKEELQKELDLAMAQDLVSRMEDVLETIERCRIDAEYDQQALREDFIERFLTKVADTCADIYLKSKYRPKTKSRFGFSFSADTEGPAVQAATLEILNSLGITEQELIDSANKRVAHVDRLFESL